MKAILSIIAFGTTMFIASSCSKPCSDAAACDDQVPSGTGTTCQAYWETWFYNESTGDCELKGYSGCGPLGFDTQEECEKCECNN